MQLAIIGLVLTTGPAQAKEKAALIETLKPSIERIELAMRAVPDDRQAVLRPAVEYVAEKLQREQPARLTFICTHNSRRSHLGQVWAKVAAEHYGLRRVETYSGGTEATACNLRTVKALRRAGLQVVATDASDNPKYLIQYADNRPAMTAFSKVYDQRPNPNADYLAMMCCSDADENCPIVRGATERVALHYVDPKQSDDTPEEATTYDERSQQIASEMFYLFSEVAKQVKR